MIANIMAIFHTTSIFAILFWLITSICGHCENPIACSPTPLIKIVFGKFTCCLLFYLKSETILRLFGKTFSISISNGV